jgi:hypothetical protein
VFDGVHFACASDAFVLHRLLRLLKNDRATRSRACARQCCKAVWP